MNMLSNRQGTTKLGEIPAHSNHPGPRAQEGAVKKFREAGAGEQPAQARQIFSGGGKKFGSLPEKSSRNTRREKTKGTGYDQIVAGGA